MRQYLYLLAVMFAGIALPRAAAQEVLQPKGLGATYLVRPGGIADPGAGLPLGAAPGALFAPTGGPGPAPGPTSVLGAGGQAGGGLGLSGTGNLQIGFNYIVPLWTFRDFTLAVPAANGSQFPLLGNTGHVDNHFGLSPRVDYNYYFEDLDFGVKASGMFLNLNGHLHQEVAGSSGTGQLDATSNLTLVVANLLEFRKHYEGAEFFKGTCCDHPAFNDMLIDLSIGSRYSSISQNYTGSLSNGAGTNSANISTRFSSQSFSGVGLTGSCNLGKEVKQGWFLFNDMRASVLVGDNRRSSSLSVNVIGTPGVPSTISETKTLFLPVLEWEVGFQWQTPIMRSRVTAQQPALFILRSAFVSQYWADVGPLSAGSTQAFRQSDLFLVGVTVLAGISY